MRENCDMSDVKCPYCSAKQDINHDDCYGYEEDQEYEQNCRECGKTFIFITSIMYHYNVKCQEGDHDMKPFGDEYPGMYECSKCDFYELRKD